MVGEVLVPGQNRAAAHDIQPLDFLLVFHQTKSTTIGCSIGQTVNSKIWKWRNIWQWVVKLYGILVLTTKHELTSRTLMANHDMLVKKASTREGGNLAWQEDAEQNTVLKIYFEPSSVKSSTWFSVEGHASNNVDVQLMVLCWVLHGIFLLIPFSLSSSRNSNMNMKKQQHL